MEVIADERISPWTAGGEQTDILNEGELLQLTHSSALSIPKVVNASMPEISETPKNLAHVQPADKRVQKAQPNNAAKARKISVRRMKSSGNYSIMNKTNIEFGHISNKSSSSKCHSRNVCSELIKSGFPNHQKLKVVSIAKVPHLLLPSEKTACIAMINDIQFDQSNQPLIRKLVYQDNSFRYGNNSPEGSHTSSAIIAQLKGIIIKKSKFEEVKVLKRHSKPKEIPIASTICAVKKQTKVPCQVMPRVHSTSQIPRAQQYLLHKPPPMTQRSVAMMNQKISSVRLKLSQNSSLPVLYRANFPIPIVENMILKCEERPTDIYIRSLNLQSKIPREQHYTQ